MLIVDSFNQEEYKKVSNLQAFILQTKRTENQSFPFDRMKIKRFNANTLFFRLYRKRTVHVSKTNVFVDTFS
jgi:hypothetical protein